MVAPRQEEDVHLPSVDYSLTNIKLLPRLCHLLPLKFALVAAQGRLAPPPQHATLTVGLYADGYQPRGRPNISMKIGLIHFEGPWFPLARYVRRCTDMISWFDSPKIVDVKWVPKRA